MALRALAHRHRLYLGQFAAFQRRLRRVFQRGETWLLRFFHLEKLPFDVRKLAHFCEYAALGALSGATFAFAQNHSASRLLNHALLGLLAAVIDESIQVLSGRGPLVTDIWIDAAGYWVGLLAALLLWRLLRRLRPKRA